MDGRPLRDHLKSQWRQTGVMPDQLAQAPQCPEGLEPLWQDFLDLHCMRGSSGFGPSRITYHDIDAMQRVRGITMPPWQVQAITAADAAFFEVRSEEQ